MKTRLMGLAAVLAVAATACGGGVGPAAAPGPSEGIAVHGDWTIEVYNDDGTLDERVEFENALVPAGAATLVRLLAGQAVTNSTGYLIEFGDGSFEGDWAGCLAESIPCNIAAPVAGKDNSEMLDNTSDGLADMVRYRAETTVLSDVTVEVVRLVINTCGKSNTPENCGLGTGDGLAFLTAKTLDAADVVTVSSGQTVQFEVVISFTTG